MHRGFESPLFFCSCNRAFFTPESIAKVDQMLTKCLQNAYKKLKRLWTLLIQVALLKIIGPCHTVSLGSLSNGRPIGEVILLEA